MKSAWYWFEHWRPATIWAWACAYLTVGLVLGFITGYAVSVKGEGWAFLLAAWLLLLLVGVGCGLVYAGRASALAASERKEPHDGGARGRPDPAGK